MRAFISVDLEGLPYVTSPLHLRPGTPLYDEAREIATEVVNIAAEVLYSNGFDEITVADSHGPMVNVIPSKLPEYVELVRGYPRPISMVSGVEGSDVALFLGYHAKSGTGRASFDHTYSSATIDWIKVNGVEVSEFLLNAYVLGKKGIPVVLVAGDRVLLEGDVKVHAPWAVRVPLKDSISRYSSKSPSMAQVRARLTAGITEASIKFSEGEMKSLTTEEPVNVEIRFLGSHMADTAELLPFAERLDGKRVAFQVETVEDAYRVIQLLSVAAYGTSSLVG
ncbi:M55 family metallopeptidase [Thermococcus sp. Bubb.Bath]|uniref:M55 family metallopeptidase n=1 Tax=Thermococcus sp. Bubb.Bath TaxID=1638242 RepID=UPI001439231F|nr:M55 family metallopeptidase [Thermococcus sp. Bubb.Bath]NJF25520.1 peptide transporter [Thermococcus sp. Bubb.Bath]